MSSRVKDLKLTPEQMAELTERIKNNPSLRPSPPSPETIQAMRELLRLEERLLDDKSRTGMVKA